MFALHLCPRQIALDNAKNYQLWNHRRKMAKALGPSFAQQEFAFVSGGQGRGAMAVTVAEGCKGVWGGGLGAA